MVPAPGSHEASRQRRDDHVPDRHVQEVDQGDRAPERRVAQVVPATGEDVPRVVVDARLPKWAGVTDQGQHLETKGG